MPEGRPWEYDAPADEPNTIQTDLPRHTGNPFVDSALSIDYPAAVDEEGAATNAMIGAGAGTAIAGGAAVLPFLPRIAGATAGAAEGNKRGGTLGAVAGGVTGAVFPGATTVGTGISEGYDLAGLPGAVGGAALGGMFGGKAKETFNLLKAVFGAGKKVKDAAKIAKEVEAAAKAAEIAKAVPRAAKSAPKAAEILPGFDSTQLMQLKTAWENKASRQQIREWVAQQAPEVQQQIKQFLMSQAMR